MKITKGRAIVGVAAGLYLLSAYHRPVETAGNSVEDGGFALRTAVTAVGKAATFTGALVGGEAAPAEAATAQAPEPAETAPEATTGPVARVSIAGNVISLAGLYPECVPVEENDMHLGTWGALQEAGLTSPEIAALVIRRDGTLTGLGRAAQQNYTLTVEC